MDLRSIAIKQPPVNEVIDHVLEHLYVQRLPATTGTSCRYRDEDTGRTCAIGCLLTDEDYRPAFEGQGYDIVLRDLGLTAKLRNYLTIFDELQELHDSFGLGDRLLDGFTLANLREEGSTRPQCIDIRAGIERLATRLDANGELP